MSRKETIIEINQDTRYSRNSPVALYRSIPISGAWMFDEKRGELFTYRRWWQFWKRGKVYVETAPGSNKFKKWKNQQKGGEDE